MEFLKNLAETITAISTAVIVIITASKKLPKGIKAFFFMFFGGIQNDEGKKLRFFKALKQNKENYERTQRIIKAIIEPNNKSEEYLVLNKDALEELIKDSKLFTHISIN